MIRKLNMFLSGKISDLKLAFIRSSSDNHHAICAMVYRMKHVFDVHPSSTSHFYNFY
jgi:hypothetical protein